MKDKGFTLIELLIAILIFSVVAVAIYSTFSTGLIAWKKGEDSSNLYQEARLALDKMSLELRNALFYSNIHFVGKANELYFATLLPSPGKTGQLRLSRVTYYLDNDNYSLQRREESLRTVLQGDIEEAKELASPVKELKFSYAYEYPGKEGEESQLIWEDDWEDEETVPSLMKISLTLQKKKSPREEASFTETIHIPSGTIGTIEEKEK